MTKSMYVQKSHIRTKNSQDISELKLAFWRQDYTILYLFIVLRFTRQDYSLVIYWLNKSYWKVTWHIHNTLGFNSEPTRGSFIGSFYKMRHIQFFIIRYFTHCESSSITLIIPSAHLSQLESLTTVTIRLRSGHAYTRGNFIFSSGFWSSSKSCASCSRKASGTRIWSQFFSVAYGKRSSTLVPVTSVDTKVMAQSAVALLKKAW